MKKNIIISVMAVAVCLLSFKKDKHVAIAIPDGWPAPVYDFKKHPLSKDKIELGRMLFYDPVLSRDSTISCASCHLQYTAFTHVDHSLSHGIEGRIGTRNSPVLVNLAWSNSFMWDGSVASLDRQAVNPITNKLEMDESMPHVIQKLERSPVYSYKFRDAFGNHSIKEKDVLEALSQFMLTFTSANSRYDRVQRGEDTFTKAEQNGYRLFKANCASCHTEPLFTNGGFENNGLTSDETLNDIGRMKVTKLAADSLKFKVPTLRNIALSYPYMHDGRFKNISMVLNNYIRGIAHTATLSPRLQKGIYFTPAEKADVIAFLYTLTDSTFLRNPDYGYSAK